MMESSYELFKVTSHVFARETEENYNKSQSIPYTKNYTRDLNTKQEC
jgi:hypothetical protein